MCIKKIHKISYILLIAYFVLLVLFIYFLFCISDLLLILIRQIILQSSYHLPMSGEMIVYYKVSNSNTRFFVPLVNTTCPYKATDIGGAKLGCDDYISEK